MRKIILFSIFLCLTFIIQMSIPSKGLAINSDTIKASNPLIEYTGRIDFTQPDAPRFSYSGVSIRANFNGTSIAAIMDDDTGKNYYNIILDGKVIDILLVTTGKKIYPLVQGLESGIHEIEIFKRTELTFGKTTFYGFTVDKGSNLVPIVSKKEKLIEYIGNSITCGYGNEGVSGGTFGPETENHYMTYAAITSRNFNARHLAVCRSGIGIYRNYDGPVTGNEDNMTNYYTRTFLYDENPKYTFSERPDLVCIDLGTNDFSTKGCDSARFINNYFRLIDTIQTRYTNPDILCLVGPMMSGSSLSTIKRYLNYICTTANKKGKGNVYFFEMSAQTGDLGIGIDSHPTVAQHKRNGLELTQYIKELKGWKVNPFLMGATMIDSKHIKIDFNTPIQDKLNNFGGFAVYSKGVKMTIDRIYTDSSNTKTLHIYSKDLFKIGEAVGFSYTPGTVESVDSVALGAIHETAIQNILTETKITKGSTNAAGNSILLTFNKKIRTKGTIEGLKVTHKSGEIVVDSFKTSGTQITLYPKNKVAKGDSIFVTYNGNSIEGTDGIPLTLFNDLAIKNISTSVSVLLFEDHIAEIFPNPSKSGKFFYQISNSVTTKGGIVEVFNPSGSKVSSQQIEGTRGTVDLNGTGSKGIYIVRFSFSDRLITKSLAVL